jgi:outer membrane immunogenic protein
MWSVNFAKRRGNLPRRFVLRRARRDNDWLRLTSDDLQEVRVLDGGVAMRRFLMATAIVGLASGASAADMPDYLRGSIPPTLSTTRVNWQGYYIGGQAGYGSSDESFNGSTRTMMAALLSNTVIENEMGVSQWNLGLGKESARTSGFGGFVGYNLQWDDVVLGIEASYLHGKFGGASTASEERVSPAALSDSFFHDVKATSQAAISISDMATFRARAGYAYGSFLPYLFGGVALGNADISRTVTVDDHFAPTLAGAIAACPVPPGSPPPFCAHLSATEAQHNHLIYGYTAGLGVDINLIGGLFMRAEWEYIRFTASVDTSINTVRAGLGYKF